MSDRSETSTICGSEDDEEQSHSGFSSVGSDSAMRLTNDLMDAAESADYARFTELARDADSFQLNW